jgi:hypothetical protein
MPFPVSPLHPPGERHHSPMRAFLLLVVLICIAAYVNLEQPATWNSWMTAVGLGSPSDSPNAQAASAAPSRTALVGGLIQDGNFTSPAGIWQGDGRPDASGKGLVVTLNPTSWTRVYQTFASDAGTLYSIEVTYKLSPGLTFSKDPADYTDISKRLQIDGFDNYSSMAISPGNCYGTLGDPNSNRIAMEVFAPQLGSTQVEDYQHSYPSIPPNGNKTFALAFPPGTGTITLLTAYVKSH